MGYLMRTTLLPTALQCSETTGHSGTSARRAHLGQLNPLLFSRAWMRRNPKRNQALPCLPPRVRQIDLARVRIPGFFLSKDQALRLYAKLSGAQPDATDDLAVLAKELLQQLTAV